MKCFAASFIALIILVVFATTVQADVSIETVPVGNTGNVGDTEVMTYDSTTGYGSVNYAYRIGKYEVTAGQYCEFLNAVAASDPYGLYNGLMDTTLGCQITRHGSSGSYTYDFSGRPTGNEADWKNRPVNFVSWGGAARFCNWLHNGQPTGTQDNSTTEEGSYTIHGATSQEALRAIIRNNAATWAIPTEDEWYKAAYHKNDGDTGNYFDYPTSSDTIPGYVNKSDNLSGTGVPFTEGGTDPGNYATCNGDSATYGIDSPYYRTEVGEWENSESPYGTFDQGGNVREWNEAYIGIYSKGIRGGSFEFYDSGLHASFRGYSAPATWGAVIGFRVVQVPEPTTITLLLCGLVSLALLRRRNKV